VSPALSAYGVSLSPPGGFEGRVFRRPANGEVSAAAADGPPAPAGEVPATVVHVATIPLAPDTGDFASSAVEHLGPDDVLVVLFEFEAAAGGRGLFAREGMPRAVQPDDFSPSVMQRAIPGQAGCQFFFSEAGRAFCLYAVIGAYARRTELAAKVTSVLATVQIQPLGAANAPAAITPPASSNPPPSTVPPAAGSGPTTTTTTPSTSSPPGTSRP
jgi:hypothetical protein